MGFRGFFRIRSAILTALTPGLLVTLIGCGGSDDPTGPVEYPQLVDDLEAVAGSANSVTLRWTVPAKRAETPVPNQVSHYDLRYTTFAQAATDWSGWSEAQQEPGPQMAGLEDTYVVTGLDAGEVYAFRLTTSYDGTNWSDPSNTTVATAAEVFDTTPPAAITDLTIWSATDHSLTAIWTIAGDDDIYGQATQYEARYSQTPITEANWDDATLGPAAAVLDLRPGYMQVTIDDLDDGATYHVAVKAVDEVGHRSALSNTVEAAAERLQTWYVKEDRSGNAPTIQWAIEQAGDGDLVLVAPGHYTWTNQGNDEESTAFILFGGDVGGFDVRSESGPELTILDAEQQESVVVFIMLNDVTFEGFTITGGLAPNGAGIAMHLNSPLIKNCIITDNEAVATDEIESQGGGIWYGGVGSPVFEDCIIENNRAEYGAGALLVNSYETFTFRNCVFRNNMAGENGGGIYAIHIDFEFDDCTIVDNRASRAGGGIALLDIHDSTVSDCTIAGNSAGLGAGIRLSSSEEGPYNPVLTLRNTIVAQNRLGAAFSMAGIVSWDLGCCNVYGNQTGDNWMPTTTDSGGNILALLVTLWVTATPETA